MSVKEPPNDIDILLLMVEDFQEDTLSLWLDTYQTGKDFTRRGIVEVELS